MINKIQLRFASESASSFDKFNFPSESVTYEEILQFLARRKKLDSTRKTDQITLFNIDKSPFEEIKGGATIDAGTRLMVIRKPPESLVKQTAQNPQAAPNANQNQSSGNNNQYVVTSGFDCIELTYNQKMFQEMRSGQDQAQQQSATGEKEAQKDKKNQADDVEMVQEKAGNGQNDDDMSPDYVEPGNSAGKSDMDRGKEEGNAAAELGVVGQQVSAVAKIEETVRMTYQTFKLDLGSLSPEFMCLPSKWNDKNEPHILENPFLLKCCGQSLCQTCLKGQIIKQLALGPNLECPLCARKWPEAKNAHTMFRENRELQMFINEQLHKETDQLTDQQRVDWEKEISRRKINEQIKLFWEQDQAKAQEESQKKIAEAGKANVDVAKHKLLESLKNETTAFYLVKLPNFDCFYKALTTNEIPLLREAPSALVNSSHSVLFVTADGLNKLCGVCSTKNTFRKDSPNHQEWSSHWQGQFQDAFQVNWLIPICGLPFNQLSLLQPTLSKSLQLSSSTFLKNSSDKGADDLVSNDQNDTQSVEELLKYKWKNPVIVPIGNGSNKTGQGGDTNVSQAGLGQHLSKMCVEWEISNPKEAKVGIDGLMNWVSVKRQINAQQVVNLATLGLSSTTGNNASGGNVGAPQANAVQKHHLQQPQSLAQHRLQTQVMLPLDSNSIVQDVKWTAQGQDDLKSLLYTEFLNDLDNPVQKKEVQSVPNPESQTVNPPATNNTTATAVVVPTSGNGAPKTDTLNIPTVVVDPVSVSERQANRSVSPAGDRLSVQGNQSPYKQPTKKQQKEDDLESNDQKPPLATKVRNISRSRSHSHHSKDVHGKEGGNPEDNDRKSKEHHRQAADVKAGADLRDKDPYQRHRRGEPSRDSREREEMYYHMRDRYRHDDPYYQQQSEREQQYREQRYKDKAYQQGLPPPSGMSRSEWERELAYREQREREK